MYCQVPDIKTVALVKKLTKFSPDQGICRFEIEDYLRVNLLESPVCEKAEVTVFDLYVLNFG